MITNKDSGVISEIESSEDFQTKLMKGLLAGKPLNGPDGILTPMIKQALEAILEGEMEAHLDSQLEKETRRFPQ